MDPLSISVSIITLLQATNEILSLCLKYATAAKGAARAISEVLDEVKNLRNILESLEQLTRSGAYADLALASQVVNIRTLCDGENGPIAKELKYLEEKLRPPEWASQDGSRRKNLFQSLAWPLKETETKKTLTNIERLKGSLGLLLTVNQT